MPGLTAAAQERARLMAERQLQHMVRLVDDLLDVSRIMRGKIELRKQPVDLTEVIARAVETVQPALDAHGQHLEVALPPGPLPLEADPARLAQVLANLLHNAAKFSERGAPIWLTAERDGSAAVIRVRDVGAGIRADVLPHVFDLFVQGDQSLERTRGGLGIGLTVVRQLVELHGGTVTAASAGLGKGSEFTVRLPGLREAAPAGPADPDAVPAAVAQKRVLVVDDNVDAAESLGLLLRLWGHDVRLAHNGPDVLRAAEDFRPAVVLLDIGLPGMNGFEVARRLRQGPAGRHAVLVALTGYGQEEDRRLAAEAGFDHHLTKPVDPERLQTLLGGQPATAVVDGAPVLGELGV
jgi:CheY-like chemotaxis protein